MAGYVSIFIVGLDGDLWRADGPFLGQLPPHNRVQVDTTVAVGTIPPKFNPIFAFDLDTVMVHGSDDNLWLERGPFGNLPWVEADFPNFPSPLPPPSQRCHIDGNVLNFYPWSPEGPFFVIGKGGVNFWPWDPQFDQVLWCENPNWHWRFQIDGNVGSAQPLAFSDDLSGEVFVCSQDGALWQEFGPFGTVPLPTCFAPPFSSCRNLVDTNVSSFQAIDSNTVFVLDPQNNLWLYSGPFGGPPTRVPVDGNVGQFQAVTSREVYVLGLDGKLWLEFAPFGAVPLPTCTQIPGQGCRLLVTSNVPNVSSFNVLAEGEIYVLDTSNILRQIPSPLGAGAGNPPVIIDENVFYFQPVGPFLRPGPPAF